MAVARALLERCEFPAPGSEIACAVSGGPDSLALLVLAVEAGLEATAYHVDHGLRAGSADEAAVVARAARTLGCGFVARSVALVDGSNIEARARAARYAALPAEVATGHTADDQAETVLLNLMRGAGLDGLAAMRAGPRHPILRLRRSETHDLVRHLGLEVVSDPSNEDRTIRRNRVRAELLPLLQEISGRDLVPVLCRQAELFDDEAAFLDQAAAAVDATSVAELRGVPVALRRRALRRLVSSLVGPYPPPAAAIARVLSVVDGATRAAEVPGGLRIRRSKGRLMLERRVRHGADGPRSDSSISSAR